MKQKPIRLPKLATVVPGDKRSSRLYYDLRLYLETGWHETVRAYEANPGSFYNAWHYLNEHPVYWKLERYGAGQADLDALPLRHLKWLLHDYGFGSGGISMAVARVAPDGRTSGDPALNTRTEVWLETGEFAWSAVSEHHVEPGTHYHNYKLDCGGGTYEEAVVKMARNVHRFYGNDRRRCAPEYEQRQLKKRSRGRKGRYLGRLVAANPYAHACRHSYPAGAEGTIAAALAATGGKS
jgi:hypothetical protein